MIEIAKKYKAEYDSVTGWGKHSAIPDRCRMPDAYQKYLSKYAASYKISTNELCGRDEVMLTFFDAGGDLIGGYYIRPDQVDYAVECIIRK